MNKAKLLVTILAGAILLTGTQAMAGKTSVERGKQLFNDPTLGGSANDKSCTSCHANGKGLEDASSNKKLVKNINQCITGPLTGNKIDGRSADMRSLKIYIDALSGK
jgi:cytochrome c peroxidase